MCKALIPLPLASISFSTLAHESKKAVRLVIMLTNGQEHRLDHAAFMHVHKRLSNDNIVIGWAQAINSNLYYTCLC
jgi:hypothetical protein